MRLCLLTSESPLILFFFLGACVATQDVVVPWLFTEEVAE